MTDDVDDNVDRSAESRARTYLAIERTFLAWFRTAAAMVALGLAAAQFLTREALPAAPVRRALAVAFVVAGILAVLAGLRRYYRAARQVASGEYRPSRYSVISLAALLLVIAALAVVFIFATGPA